MLIISFSLSLPTKIAMAVMDYTGQRAKAINPAASVWDMEVNSHHPLSKNICFRIDVLFIYPISHTFFFSLPTKTKNRQDRPYWPIATDGMDHIGPTAKTIHPAVGPTRAISLLRYGSCTFRFSFILANILKNGMDRSPQAKAVYPAAAVLGRGNRYFKSFPYEWQSSEWPALPTYK